MRIVIDLDGTLCELRKEHMTYLELKPLPGAIECTIPKKLRA